MSEKKRMGRPRLPEGQKRGHSLMIRLRGGVRERLYDEAEKSQRSISEEVEMRLLASFDQPALVDALAQRLCGAIDRAHGWTAWDAIESEVMSPKRAKPVRNEIDAHDCASFQLLMNKG